MNQGRTARIALRALAAVVAGTLAACGGDDDGGGGHEIDTPQPLVFDDAAGGQRAVSGSISLTRHTPAARQGGLSAHESGLIRVALPGTDGAPTVRLMSMPRLMAHYLAL